MKNFLASFLGSLVGILIAGILCTLIFVVAITSSIGGMFKGVDEKPFHSKANSVLMVKFKGPILERSIESPFGELDLGNFGPKAGIGLNDILKDFEKAENDTNIKGIYINLDELICGMATLEEIRNGILKFKQSKKFVYAYSEVYSQKTYYLASVADKIFLNPQGGLDFKGLSSQLMFYKNLLEKLNVEVQIFRHGKFKSAIEPFMLDKMSEANRLQMETLINSLWSKIISGISESRKISAEELNNIADNLKVSNPQDAKELKLVDDLFYEDQVMDLIRKELKLDAEKKINFVTLSDYIRAPSKMKKENKETKDAKSGKIAVIYAVGSIESGKGDDETIGSETIAKAISEAGKDSTIKAIVLRVNSPGGSALASDVMWREVTIAKKAKPFVVSMGDVAASGGYYISCAADKIFAQPNTITGSIGVFGMMPNAQKMLSEKLGITIDTVNSNKHSDMGTAFRGVTEQERLFVQKGVEEIYDVFISRVAEGRGISKSAVDSIGQGRVWTGADALKIKLVDELGGINDAIAFAGKKAGLGDYKIISYPKQKNPLEMILKSMEEDQEARLFQKALGVQYSYIKHMKQAVSMKGIQARLPFEMILE